MLRTIAIVWDMLKTLLTNYPIRRQEHKLLKSELIVDLDKVNSDTRKQLSKWN